MVQKYFGKDFDERPPVNYERYFVPAIGAPLAEDLIRHASLRPGERVLDVACGTGIVARLASEQVGADGHVAGLDVNSGMLAVARSAASDGSSIDWTEASAESMPFADGAFDVLFCQMGLQFMPDREAALREMRRVLAPGGRFVINVPGPTPDMFAVMEEGIRTHLGQEVARFVNVVFSMHDIQEIQDLVCSADFQDVSVESYTRTLRLPMPEMFLWQYAQSTPLAGAIAKMDEDGRHSLERDVVRDWQQFVRDDGMYLDVRVVVADARK